MNKGTNKNDPKSIGKLTTSEGDRELLFKALFTNDADGLRKMDVKSMDLNIFEPVQALQFIDEEVTPLIYCAYYGKTELAKILLENKIIDCDLSTQYNGYTPMTAACLGSNYEMVKFLVDKGAQVNKPTSLFQTPLIVTLLTLIQQYQSFQQNRICMRIAGLLITHGACPNWVFEKQKGYNMLHFLCSSATKMSKPQKDLNYNLIKFLVNNGAIVSQTTLTDQRPIDLLTKHCNGAQIKKLLIQASQKSRAGCLRKGKQSEQRLASRGVMPTLNELTDISDTQTRGCNSYSRGEEVLYYKNNLLEIHGVARRK